MPADDGNRPVDLPAELAAAIDAALIDSHAPQATIEGWCAAHPEHADAIRARVRQFERPTLATGSPATAGSPPHPQRIGPYHIESVLGEGGMGTVYRARQDAPMRRTVALKVIRLGMDSAEVLARFELERRALAAMNHGCIAKVFDAGTTEQGQPYFVMEHVDGVPITDYCERAGLTTTQRIRLFRDVCAGVQHAHQKGIIHRDLKPGNILVASEGDRAIPKVLDFGLAKATDRDEFAHALLTHRHVAMGTPEYMAPEQAAGDTALLDTRADVYSLGVILYELLAGELPFRWDEVRAGGWAEIQRVLQQEDAPKPSAKASSRFPTRRAADHDAPATRIQARELRGDLDWIVMMAMAKEPARRYESADALAEDLRRSLAHEPVLAGPPSVGYRMRKFLRRYRVPVVAGALVIVALLLGGAGTYAQYLRAEQQAREATASATRARLAEAQKEQQRQRAVAATRVANVRAMKLAAQQGNSELVLELIDPLLATATSVDERAELLVRKIESSVAAGRREWRDDLRRLKELNTSDAQRTQTEIAVAIYNAYAGFNPHKTKKAFERLLATERLTAAQRAQCRAMSTDSPTEALRLLRQVLDDGYSETAMSLATMLAFLTSDVDLLRDLRGRQHVANPGDLRNDLIDCFLAILTGKPPAGTFYEQYPQMQDVVQKAMLARSSVAGLTATSQCARTARRRERARAELQRVLMGSVQANQRLMASLARELDGVSFGFGVPFMAGVFKPMIASSGLFRALAGGSITERIAADSRTIEMLPCQTTYLGRAVHREQAYDETRDPQHLLDAIDDAERALTATQTIYPMTINALIVRVRSATELLIHDGLAPERLTHWTARYPKLLRELVAHPAANTDVVSWAARCATRARRFELARTYASRWRHESPDDAVASLFLGMACYRLGAYAEAYLHGEHAIATDDEARTGATQLRDRAWSKIGWVGPPGTAAPKADLRK